jgi:hypothetical protein
MAIMREQAAAMRGQFEAVLAAQRPWITIIPTITSFDMTEFPNSSRFVSIWVKFALHNDGREPAQNIQIRQDVTPYTGNPKFSVGMGTAQEALCDEATRIFPPRMGVIKAPEGPAILAGVDDSEARYVESHVPIPDRSLFLVYGCVDYSYPPDRHGQTLFQYVLGTPSGDYYPGLITFRTAAPASPHLHISERKEGSLQPSDLDFRKDRYGRNEIR